MKIIKKEFLDFSKQETDAIRLIMAICTELGREATDPNLKKLAEKIYENVAELQKWGEE